MKQNLQEVRKERGLTLDDVASVAGVSRTTVYLAEIGVAIEKGDAEKILAVLSHIAGKQYTLDTVCVLLKQNEERRKSIHGPAFSRL